MDPRIIDIWNGMSLTKRWAAELLIECPFRTGATGKAIDDIWNGFNNDEKNLVYYMVEKYYGRRQRS